MKIIEKNLNTKLKYQNFHINVNLLKIKKKLNIINSWRGSSVG